jgi:hypothetical protein
MNHSVPWSRIVELARQIETDYLAGRTVQLETTLRLARAVLEFQERLVAGLVRPRRS